MRKSISVALIAVVLVLSMPLCSYAIEYVAYTLSSGEHGAYAYDMNDFGQIVGIIDTTDPGAQPSQSAVLWNRYDSSPQFLDDSTAHLINSSGLVAGHHVSVSGYDSIWTWNATNGLHDVYVSDANARLLINAMNNAGSMVGFLVDFPMDGSQNSTESPVALDANGQLTYLDNSCGGSGGHARGINDAGYIVGCSYALGRDWGHASLWQPDGNATDLGAFGATWSGAVAINNAGQVVGGYGSDDGSGGSFLWSMENGTVLIPTCPLLDNGLFGAIDINDNGVVLGTGQVGGIQTVVTWSMTGGFTIVGTGVARAINNDGWIAGHSPYTGEALVWQPVPEPSSVVAVLVGIAGAAGAFRRSRLV